MSSRNSQKYKSNTSPSPPYQPIPKNILADSSEMTNNSDDNGEVIVDRTGAGALPTTYSSQQLMQSSDSESVGNGGDGRAAGGVDNEDNRNRGTPLRLSHVSRSQWFTVIVLCFVNLINYMDRFTIAAKKFVLFTSRYNEFNRITDLNERD
ncbi:hypothetical protein GQX74_005354 [Glossina fuscipes]|nr:hypothetical protein GQX74_005354 [Glossina fuscipes]